MIVILLLENKGIIAININDCKNRLPLEDDETKNLGNSEIAHDLRNALENATLTAELLQRKLRDLFRTPPVSPKENRPREKIMDISTQLMQAITHLTEMIPDVEHPENSFDAVRFLRVNIKKLINDVVTNYQHSRSHGVRIYEMHYFAQSDFAVIDPDKVTRILENLLSNATKFTEQGMIIVEILEAGNEWIISIKDSGSGIPPEELPHIFNKEKPSSVKHSKSGRGLGLSIVKRFVEMHRGRIQVSSIPGRRTIFTIRIPQNLEQGTYNLNIK